jgi:excisionase family DNA binding protein
MFEENIFTIEEVSQHLRVPVDAVRKEIASGRLRAINVAGHIRVRESALNSYKNEAQEVLTPTAAANTGAKEQNFPKLAPAPDFTYTWPDGKVEQFTEVREGIASYGGKEHHVKLGFTLRKSAGKSRRRCLVLVDRYATVEFVGANEAGNGKMASIIKDRNGKQLPIGGTLPPEYEDLPVEPYRDVVKGPGASNGLGVVCGGENFDTMIKHALIRYRFREDRT